jgi:hypothetical protein
MKKLICILMILFPVVAFTQQPWYKYSPMDYAWQYVGNVGFSAGATNNISFAFNPVNGQPYVAFQDLANSQKVTVMKFDGTNWVNVGNTGFSAASAWYISLALSITGQPYVAYDDYQFQPEGQATVMMFNDTNWVNVGIAGFSGGAAWYTSLAINPSGEPYVAYSDGSSYGGAVTVMKFDSSNWVYVGNPGFSASIADYVNLALSPTDGEPYVAYQDYAYDVQATVMKFDGLNWVNVGNPGFSPGHVTYTSIVFNPIDYLPYVAFTAASEYGDTDWIGVTVMRLDGNNWVNVGPLEFTGGGVWPQSLAFSPSGEPYVAYSDGGWNFLDKATVMKFDGTSWIYVGAEGFSGVGADYTSLAFSPSGQLWVAYNNDTSGMMGPATVMKYDSVFVGIKEQQKSKFSLYPDPARDKITIEIADDQTPSQLSMMNMNGEEILTRSLIKPKTQIDINNLPSGVYFVRLTNDKTVEVRKFSKQ